MKFICKYSCNTEQVLQQARARAEPPVRAAPLPHANLPPRCLRKQRSRCQKTEGRSSRLLLEAGYWDQECPGKKPTQSWDAGRMGRTWPTPTTPCRSPTPQGKPCGAEDNHCVHGSEQHPAVCKHPTAKLLPPAKARDIREVTEGSWTHIP